MSDWYRDAEIRRQSDEFARRQQENANQANEVQRRNLERSREFARQSYGDWFDPATGFFPRMDRQLEAERRAAEDARRAADEGFRRQQELAGQAGERQRRSAEVAAAGRDTFVGGDAGAAQDALLTGSGGGADRGDLFEQQERSREFARQSYGDWFDPATGFFPRMDRQLEAERRAAEDARGAADEGFRRQQELAGQAGERQRRSAEVAAAGRDTFVGGDAGAAQDALLAMSRDPIGGADRFVQQPATEGRQPSPEDRFDEGPLRVGPVGSSEWQGQAAEAGGGADRGDLFEQQERSREFARQSYGDWFDPATGFFPRMDRQLEAERRAAEDARGAADEGFRRQQELAGQAGERQRRSAEVAAAGRDTFVGGDAGAAQDALLAMSRDPIGRRQDRDQDRAGSTSTPIHGSAFWAHDPGTGQQDPFLERGVLTHTDHEGYMVRIGRAERAGSFGAAIFDDLTEARRFAADLAQRSERDLRAEFAFPLTWPDGSAGSPIGADEAIGVTVWTVPAGTPYIVGVVGPQNEAHADERLSTPVWPGGGVQVLVPQAVQLQPASNFVPFVGKQEESHAEPE